MHVTLRSTLTFGLAVALLGGCGSGSGSSRSTTAAPVSSGSTASPVTTLSPATAATSAPPAVAANPGPDLVAYVFSVEATGSDSIEFQGVTISASGSIDESVDIGEVKLIGDDNQNGTFEVSEADLVVVPTPAFARDNGSVDLDLATPVTIAPGASLQLLVVAEVTGGNGETLRFEIATESGLVVNDSTGPIAPGGSFPMPGAEITIGSLLPAAADHLLLTELVWSAGTAVADFTGAEFIEVHNPTAAAVDLSTYYLTDGNQDPTRGGYHDLPGHPANGSKLGLVSSSFDFVMRFPVGATLAPGATVTVAISGTGYTAAYGVNADYCMGARVGATIQMVNYHFATDTFSAVPPTGATVWFWPGEKIALFTWDGTSDLVQDVDIVNATGVLPAAKTDKTTIFIDGPDANVVPTPYQADTPAAQQAAVGLAGRLVSRRVDMLETGEIQTGGNGITGNDETSEPFAQTWASAIVATPGQP